MSANNKIYLNIPYSEKNNGKKAGALWDSKMKSWYITSRIDSKQKNNILKRWERIYIKVPFDEKNEVKRMGGKWDSMKKQWYIPAHSKSKNNVLNKWGTKAISPKKSRPIDIQSAIMIQKHYRGLKNRKKARATIPARQVFSNNNLRSKILKHKTNALPAKECTCNPYRSLDTGSYRRQHYEHMARTGELKRCETCRTRYPCKHPDKRCETTKNANGLHACMCNPLTAKQRNDKWRKMGKKLVPYNGTNDSQKIKILGRNMMWIPWPPK